MNVPLTWLQDYVTPNLPLEALCERLTLAGLTVESLQERAGDTVLNLEVTPNRGDWLSVLGVAREVAALVDGAWHAPTVRFPEADDPTSAHLTVEIPDPDLGPRYTGRLIRGVTVGPSPEWMHRRLEQVGIRPINNIVDVTNYVCFEYGQPLHAFDFAGIGGGKILVRRAKPGETIVTLDEEERTLTGSMLVIADARRPVAVAGVMGGLDTEVTERTVDVLLESAHFLPRSIRKTAKALGLRTEASYRFERWVDPNKAVAASDRATQLILETAGGTACRGVVDAYPCPVEPVRVELDVVRCRQVLGVPLSADEMCGLLLRLGLECTATPERLACIVPTFRNDLHQEADLVEELARLYGYDNIPTTIPANLSPHAGLSDARRREFALRDLLRSAGLNESVCYSLTTAEEAAALGAPGGDDMIALRNPLTSDATHLRTSLLPTALRVLETNARRRVEAVWTYELGTVYRLGGETTPARELRRLSLALMGSRTTSAWNRPPETRQADFFTLKGIVEQVLEFFGIDSAAFTPTVHPALHPYRAAALHLADGEVGVLGEVHPTLAEELGLRQRACVAELDYDALAQAARPLTSCRTPSRFPSADRDIAFILDEDRTWAEAEAVIRAVGGDLLESLTLFDEYRGGQVGDGKRSLACTLRFRHPERTLEEGEADRHVTAVKAALREQLGAALRE